MPSRPVGQVAGVNGGAVRTRPAVRYGTDEVPDARRVKDLGARHPSYRKLFEDGRLDIGVMFGFDTPDRAAMHGGFRALADVFRSSGWRVAEEDPRHVRLQKDVVIDGRSVRLSLRIASGHENPDAGAELLQSMRQDEVVIFAGHSRMHEGIRLSAGDPGFLYLANPAKRDLERVKFGDQDQLLVLMSCVSEQFCDELRTRKGPERLKIFAANRQLSLSDYPDMIDRFIETLQRQGSAQELLDALDKGNMFTPEGAWGSFGFADDPAPAER
ncbi:MAG: hypothetical protein HY903_18440 [Deltaproteobacteria bacterium]|nr:hypothetical protein [Deltaproteobacteria bacterium]